MKWWLSLLIVFWLVACAPQKLGFDPRPYLTPREVYLVFDLAYGDDESPRWQDLSTELAHLHTLGLVELYPRPESVPSASMTIRGFAVAQALGWEEDFHGHPDLHPDQKPPSAIKLTLAEDLHPLPGESDFYRLSRDAGQEKGKQLAAEEFAHETYRFLFLGVETPTISANTEVFLLQHGIYAYRLSASLLAPVGLQGIVAGYNAQMLELWQGKLSENPFTKPSHHLPPMASDFPYLTCREIYLLLDMAWGTRTSLNWYEMVPELNQLEVSGLIARHLDEERASQYRSPIASLTPKGKHLVYLLGVSF